MMIEDYITGMTQGVIDGEQDPLVAIAELKSMAAIIKKAITEIEPVAIDEASKYGKTFDYMGFRFTQTDGRRMYSFKYIESWNNIKEELSKVEEEAKKAAGIAGTYVTDDGEVVDPARVTFTKPSLSIKA